MDIDDARQHHRYLAAIQLDEPVEIALGRACCDAHPSSASPCGCRADAIETQIIHATGESSYSTREFQNLPLRLVILAHRGTLNPLDLDASGKPFVRGPGLGLLPADLSVAHTTDARFNGGTVTLCGRGLSVSGGSLRSGAGNPPCPECADVVATWSRRGRRS